MPFENVSAEEAARLGQLLRTDALRARKRDLLAQPARTMPPTQGKKGKTKQGAPQSTGEPDGAEIDAEERVKLSTSTDPPYFNQMGYVDRVVAALDTLQHKYALTRTREASARPPAEKIEHGQTGRAGDDDSHKGRETDAVQRPYPFPSLFLDSPAAFVERTWAVAKTPAERRADAAALDSSRPPPPPALLLSDAAPQPTHPACGSGTSATRKSQEESSSSTLRDDCMYTLDLAKDKAAASRVVTVLQSEMGLAISTDFTAAAQLVDRHSRPREQCGEEAKKTSDMADADVFLMSSDATSCVLLACRVSLHPRWGGQVTHSLLSDAAAEVPGLQTVDKAFLALAMSTHTAAMVHMDRAEGVLGALEGCVWEGAVPAWLHAVARHYVETHSTSDRSTEDDAEVDIASSSSSSTATASTRSASVHRAVEALQSLLASTADTEAAATPPLLQVEWYLVGGIADKKHTAPVLTKVFESFFPFAEAQASGTDGGARHLLATSLPLTSLLHMNHEGAGSTAGMRITVGHRLCEDAICTWSFNTNFRSWSMDRNPNTRYCFPVCYGLLLDVAQGTAWPCQIQPGKRAYPLGEVRPLFASQYHATYPLEHEPADPQDRSQTKPGTAVLQVYRQRMAFATVLSQLWAQGQETRKPANTETERQQPTTQPLTLARFVDECLHVLRYRQNAEPGAADAAVRRPRHFPLLLRTRLPDLWTRYERAPDAVPFAEVPEQMFLQCSTTPHCEPPDFCALIKRSYVCMSVVGPEDVYAALSGTADVGKDGEFPADGILLEDTPL